MWANQMNDIAHQQVSSTQQQYANAAQARNNYVALVDPDRWTRIKWSHPRVAVAADLGIIDQNLDDKIGMES